MLYELFPQLAPSPFIDAFTLCAYFIAVTWGLSVLTREYSWTDRVWSIAPAVYAIFVADAADFSNARLNLMAGLVTLWAVRLTVNFARKGGYWKGGEDYRWEIIMKRTKPWQFQVFNATFISPYQNVLIYLFVAPMHTAWLHQDVPLGALDFLGAALFLLLLAGETIADFQMLRFQDEKKGLIEAGETIKKPFYDEGLYAYSRHPNYFCEFNMWWVLNLFAVAASGHWLNWTLVGALLLHTLFEGSTRFTESISLSKYPSYADYQRRVSRLIPMPPRK
jgi:steroid 5-alpha reductase family enzyme